MVDRYSNQSGGKQMAKKIIFVSDLSGKELDANSAVRVTVSFSDARRGTYVVDAAEGDAEVQKLISVGTKQARRGRKPKSQA
jgi:hypothetical protein